jgi:histidine triad (HIT) family protein
MSECLFCRIVSGELRAAVVAEDEWAMAFRDISPQAPSHILVIPKQHIGSLGEAAEEDAVVLGRLLLLAKVVARDEGLASGYRVVLNDGAAAGQSVFHIHAHVLGGRHLGWPPG